MGGLLCSILSFIISYYWIATVVHLIKENFKVFCFVIVLDTSLYGPFSNVGDSP